MDSKDNRVVQKQTVSLLGASLGTVDGINEANKEKCWLRLNKKVHNS